LRNARVKGHVPGVKRKAIDIPKVRERIAAGESVRAVAKALKISPPLLYLRLQEDDAKQAAFNAELDA
jgi:DNA invertase Pin-like site-specific DNA recombinase